MVPYLEVHIGPMILSLKHPLSFLFSESFALKTRDFFLGGDACWPTERRMPSNSWMMVASLPFLMPQTVPTGLHGSPEGSLGGGLEGSTDLSANRIDGLKRNLFQE